MNYELAMITLLPAALIAAGTLVLWYASAVPPPRGPVTADTTHPAEGTHPAPGAQPGTAWAGEPAPRESYQGQPWLAAARWLGAALVLSGILIAETFMTHVLAVFFWIATVLIAVAAVFRFRAAEQRSMLWVLTAAAQRKIPLHEAARAFAAERNDRVGERAGRLADYLEAGVPLGLSLQRAGIRVSPGVRLAADLGQHTGTLTESLRTANDGEAVEATMKYLAQWLFYFGFLVVSISAVQIPPNLKPPPPADACFSPPWSDRVTLSPGRTPATTAPRAVRPTVYRIVSGESVGFIQNGSG